MKKKKEPQPYFFTNIPKKELDKLLKDDEDKTMTKKAEQTSEKKARAPKKSLTPEDISRRIGEWNDKTTSEWANEFGVS